MANKEVFTEITFTSNNCSIAALTAVLVALASTAKLYWFCSIKLDGFFCKKWILD